MQADHAGEAPASSCPFGPWSFHPPGIVAGTPWATGVPDPCPCRILQGAPPSLSAEPGWLGTGSTCLTWTVSVPPEHFVSWLCPGSPPPGPALFRPRPVPRPRPLQAPPCPLALPSILGTGQGPQSVTEPVTGLFPLPRWDEGPSCCWSWGL